MKHKDTFFFKVSWCSTLLKCPANIRLEVLDAVMSYSLYGKYDKISDLAEIIFNPIKEEISDIRAKNEAIVEKRRRAINLRWQREKEQKQTDNNGTNDTNEYTCIHMNTNEYTCINQEKESNKEKEDIYNNINNNILLTNNINKEKKANKKKKVFTQSEQQFEDFRQHYPGIKRGFQIEFDNFKKKHPNWQDILPLLIPAVDRLIAYSERCRARGQFVAEYPHLQTWLNQSRWEIEYPEVTEPQNSTNYGTSTLSDYDRRQEEFRQHIIDKLSSPDDDEPDLSDIL